MIEAKRKADAPIAEYEGMPVQKGVGRFGPFIKWNGVFINVNKNYNFDNLSESDCIELIEEKIKKDKEKIITSFDEKNITVEKGSITINGVSLTVVDSSPDSFSVAIIPYTYENTNFKTIGPGSVVNLEFDILGKYIAKIIAKKN